MSEQQAVLVLEDGTVFEGVAFGAKLLLPAGHPIVRAAVILGLFGLTYLGATLAFGVSEARSALGRIRRLLGGKSAL